MDEKNAKLKIFLWDQFIRPLKKLMNRHTLQSALIALVIVNFVSFKSVPLFWISIILVLGISIIDIIKYWKSGEYMSHYRKEKYPEYKKTLKEIKKKKTIPLDCERPKQSIEIEGENEDIKIEKSIEIEDVEGDVNAENIIEDEKETKDESK